MPITLKGLGSGLDYESWIKQLVGVKQSKIDKVSSQVKSITKQEDALSSLKTNYTDLLTSIETFTLAFSSDSVFTRKTATSSDDAITAKADYTATTQSFDVSVASLATATKAQSDSTTAASYVDESTKLSDIANGALNADEENVKKFSIYVDGAKHDITITDPNNTNRTLGDVIADINNIDGGTSVSATLTDGKLKITELGSAEVTVGSASDTSNFSKVMSLKQDGTGEYYESSKAIFDTNTSTTLTTASFASGNVTEGTFKIGNATFTIDEGTSLDSLVADINENEDAGVSAFWDPNSGKLVLTAKDEGAFNINIEAITSNFTDIMGLTTSTWENGTATSTQLATDSQELGSNAVLTINDTTITSPSNTVTSDISGITGLTLTLNEETTSTATVNIASDTEALSNAITTFVNAFNKVITNTDAATAGYDKTKNTEGTLHGESVLNMIRNSLRTTATASVDGEEGYKTLASIGITTGAIGTEVGADTNKLVINTEKLTAALKSDPEAVKKLLIGDSSTNTEGVLTKLSESIEEKALDSVDGYFVKREDSYEKQADRLNNKIDKMNADLENYKKQLEAKFSAMDELISGLQNSAAVFDSYFNKKSSDSDK